MKEDWKDWVSLPLCCLTDCMPALFGSAGKTLIRCLYTTTDRARLSGYPGIGEAAFGKLGLVTVHVFHKMSLLGLCILLLMLEGRLLAESFQDWIGDLDRPEYIFDWTRHWIWVGKWTPQATTMG